MLFPKAIFAALVLLQEVPQESKGLQILWVPSSLSATSNTAPGFKFRHPISRDEMCFSKAKDLKKIIESMPAQMKENGIWISTTNSFLYSEEENKELKELVRMAKPHKIHVFKCEIPEQPLGWKKVDQ